MSVDPTDIFSLILDQIKNNNTHIIEKRTPLNTQETFMLSYDSLWLNHFHDIWNRKWKQTIYCVQFEISVSFELAESLIFDQNGMAALIKTNTCSIKHYIVFIFSFECCIVLLIFTGSISYHQFIAVGIYILYWIQFIFHRISWVLLMDYVSNS